MAAINILSAKATSERTVLVTLDGPPLQQSQIGAGDALNAATWFVHDHDSSNLYPISVTKKTTTTFEIYTLSKFSSALFTLTVGYTALLDSGGANPNASSATFPGCIYAARSRPIDQAVDLASPFLRGGLTMASNGDFANHSGPDLLRKLVVRRLTTRRGAFFHLPDYGIGLDLKKPLPLADLAALRIDVEREVAKEPDLADVRSKLTLDATGVLTVEVFATLVSTGEQVGTQVVATPQGVQL